MRRKNVTRISRALLLTGVVGASLALGGCSFSASTAPSTVSSSKVSGLAEDALEQQIGIRPSIDCGVDEFPLEDGASRTCTLTDPTTDEQFDAEVSLSDVQGGEFHVQVTVADTPN
jgi:hypothetical protein